MARIVFNRGDSIVWYLFEEHLIPKDANDKAGQYNATPEFQNLGMKFRVELEPRDRADWFVSYKSVNDRHLENSESAYPYVYLCEICKSVVATNTELHTVCPSCSASLSKHIPHLEYRG